MTSRTAQIRITENFSRNLDEIERFLIEAGASSAFDSLLDQLASEVIPALEHHPAIGRDFLARSAASQQAKNRAQHIAGRIAELGEGSSLREYLMASYLVLYAHTGELVYLLAIRHHRQRAFDLTTPNRPG